MTTRLRDGASAPFVKDAFAEARATLDAFVGDEVAMQGVARFVDATCAALEQGRTLFACGNGGSLCDAMHFAEEWTGRFRRDRRALPAIALGDPATLTCIANDFGYEKVFSRQIEALADAGDVLVALSTSGESPNVVAAVTTARKAGVTTVGLLGRGGGSLRSAVDIPIVVPLATTSDRIQEVHIKVLHIVIEAVERRFFPQNYDDRPS